VASNEARFALSEVRLGLVPAVISPYVIAAIGERNARRLFLSGEAMSAKLARRVGLVHEIAKPTSSTPRSPTSSACCCKGGPNALRESKELIFTVEGGGISADSCPEAPHGADHRPAQGLGRGPGGPGGLPGKAPARLGAEPRGSAGTTSE
jgi:methylglutaconyl-CoA hydratase